MNPDEALMKALATRRSLLFSLFVILHSAFRAEGAPLNIVFLYADNLGYGDLRCYGRAEVKTPNIDRLAAEGVRCTDFHVVTATCTVSRGAVLTGRHPLRNGLLHQLGSEENWHGVGLPHREHIMPQYLREVGYATARLAEVMAAWQSETRNDASAPVRYVAKPKAAGN
jgi:hypothetical protein